MPDSLTVGELPFDPRDDAPVVTLSEPRRLAQVIVEAYQIAAESAVEAIATKDKETLAALKEDLKWTPRHMARAYRRHPELFDGSTPAELLPILAAFHCGKVKDDETAVRLYDDWMATHSGSLDRLKENIKLATQAGSKTPSLAERCAGLVNKWRDAQESHLYDTGDIGIIYSVVAGELAAEPEVAKALEKKP